MWNRDVAPERSWPDKFQSEDLDCNQSQCIVRRGTSVVITNDHVAERRGPEAQVRPYTLWPKASTRCVARKVLG